MRRLGIVMGIVLAMSASAWAQQSAEAAQAEAAKKEDLRRHDLEAYERTLQNLIAQAQPVPPASAVPRPVTQGTLGGYNDGHPAKLTVLTTNSRSDNPITSLQVGSGTWWNNPEIMTLLGLTKDQQKKMDDIFQQHRIKLIDLNASLLKEETILEPLLAADKLEESKILVQVDKIAQARAELEKDNSRLLLSLRQTLTMEQWTKVQNPANSRTLNQRR